jgi:type II secretory pathway component PulC
MTTESNGASSKEMALVSTVPVLDLKSNDGSGTIEGRDIFSLSDADDTSGNVENTPQGQLPAHLKIVGILISNPSQIIIEDTFAKKTYFIDESDPQDGIKIVKVNKDQMTINYHGQDIYVPIRKN